MARTAVIASTATATSRAMGGAMNSRAAQAQQQQVANTAAMQSQMELEQLRAEMAAMQAQQTMAATPMPEAAAPAAASNDLLGQLQKLTDLKAAGALTEEEFQLAKSKLLAG
jgi:hypothetical protein